MLTLQLFGRCRGVARFQLSELIPDGQVIKTLTLGPKRPSKNPEDCHFGSLFAAKQFHRRVLCFVTRNSAN